MLRTDNISVSFGGVHAVRHLSFEVNAGEIFSVMGPNGAGKTTVFNLISRFYDCDDGSIYLDDQEITRDPPHAVAKRGIARTFQNTELFERETVLENLMIAHHVHSRTNVFQEVFFLPRVRRQELAFRKQVEDIIDLLDLQLYRDSSISSLPYGVRKIVEVARALCLEPPHTALG